MYSEQLQSSITNESLINGKLIEVERQIQCFQVEIEKIISKSKDEQVAFTKWKQNESLEIECLETKVEKIQEKLSGIEINNLQLESDYETLQLSNPWFDIEYRRLQSQLFVKAMEVRKQFLYENVKNIKAAYIIWSKQKDYIERKNIIAEAWNWINLTIPVIGSTFASFSRMCANMGKETIGHLFIDEAGQALPQASVGAILEVNMLWQ